MRFTFLKGFTSGLINLRRFHAQKTTMKRALVILSEGAEEMETVITVDVLRRAEVNKCHLKLPPLICFSPGISLFSPFNAVISRMFVNLIHSLSVKEI